MSGSAKGYSLLQVTLHWLIAALVLWQLVFGEDVGDVAHALRNGEAVDPLLQLSADFHIYIGIAVLALAVARLLLRLTQGVPAPVPGPTLQVKLGEGLHYLFYFLLFAVPVTGLLAKYGKIHIAGEIHELAKPVFIIAIALHAGAALYHHFIVKDSVLKRMMKPGTV